MRPSVVSPCCAVLLLEPLPLASPLPPPLPRQVSPHRRGNRNATKFIRFIPVVAQCSKCERVFKQHEMPSKCEEDECPAFNMRPRPPGAS